MLGRFTFKVKSLKPRHNMCLYIALFAQYSTAKRCLQKTDFGCFRYLERLVWIGYPFLKYDK